MGPVVGGRRRGEPAPRTRSNSLGDVGRRLPEPPLHRLRHGPPWLPRGAAPGCHNVHALGHCAQRRVALLAMSTLLNIAWPMHCRLLSGERGLGPARCIGPTMSTRVTIAPSVRPRCSQCPRSSTLLQPMHSPFRRVERGFGAELLDSSHNVYALGPCAQPPKPDAPKPDGAKASRTRSPGVRARPASALSMRLLAQPPRKRLVTG